MRIRFCNANFEAIVCAAILHCHFKENPSGNQSLYFTCIYSFIGKAQPNCRSMVFFSNQNEINEERIWLVFEVYLLLQFATFQIT